MVKLWLDDVRKAPPGWLHVYTSDEAIRVLLEGKVKELSLDYDLDSYHDGGYTAHPGTGGDVSAWLYDQASKGHWDVIPEHIRIHSANYEGVCEMAWDLANLERLRFTGSL